MRPFYYLLSEEQAKKYAEVKSEIILARSKMSEVDAKAAREDIIKEIKVNDFNPEKTDNLFTVQNQIAIIPIAGMLVNKVDICAGFFGETVTTYRFIQEAVAKAENDPTIKSILFDVNSGGGNVSGCEQTGQAILNAKKPTFAAVQDMAASAAFWLASAADEIISVSKTGFFGSIGVVVEYVNRDAQDKDRGIKRTVITNTTSDQKWPNETTKAGKEVIRDELNAIFKVFVESILIKRSNKLTQKSIEDLSGKVLISEDAIDFGLADIQLSQDQIINHIESKLGGDDIDVFASDQINNTGSYDPENTTPEGDHMEETMTLKELLASDPTAKAEYDLDIKAAKKTGVEEGKAEVNAKLKKVTPIMASEVYDSAVKAQAQKVISGELSIEAFESVVAMEDMRIEREKSTGAKTDTDEAGETPAETHDLNTDSSKITSEADFKIAQDKNRKMFGMEGTI